MAARMIIAVLLGCVCAAYAGGLVGPAVATYAHAPIATYAAAPVLIDNTHFSYGYATPYANGNIDVRRDGPIASHAYSFRAGTLF